MNVGELKELIKDMPDEACVLVDYEPELDLFEVDEVFLNGFDEHNPLVELKTDRYIWRYFHD